MGEKVNPSSQEGQKSRDQKLYFYEEKYMNKAAHAHTHTYIYPTLQNGSAFKFKEKMRNNDSRLKKDIFGVDISQGTWTQHKIATWLHLHLEGDGDSRLSFKRKGKKVACNLSSSSISATCMKK